MSRPDFDFDALAHHWQSAMEAALADVARTQQGHQFYALAIHGFYAESDGVIMEPLVAVNSPAALVEDHGEEALSEGGFWSGLRWHPPDWRWSDLALPHAEERARLYRALEAEATRSTTAHWHKVEEKHRHALVQALLAVLETRKRGEPPFDALATTDDFVAFVHDESREGEAWLRKSVPQPLLDRLFPEFDEAARAREALEAMAPRARADALIAKLDVYEGPITCEEAEAWLIRMGRDAVASLIDLLKDETRLAWVSARLLGRIGCPDAEEAVPALQRAMREGPDEPGRRWAATALGQMRKLEILEAGLDDPEVDVAAAHGLVGARPHSFAILEKALTTGSAAVRSTMEDELQPGRGGYLASYEELDLLREALHSSGPVLRRSIVSSLPMERVSETETRRVVDILLSATNDEDEAVRRLVALQLQWTAPGADGVQEALEALRRDPCESVRRAATPAEDDG